RPRGTPQPRPGERPRPARPERTVPLPRSFLLRLLLAGPALDPIDSHFEGLERKKGALEPDRPQLDPQHLEHVVPPDPLHLFQRLSADLFGQHGRRGAADRASLAREANVLDLPTPDLQVDANLVPAERVRILGADIGMLERAEIPGVLVVVENVLAVQIIEAHR